VVDFSVFRTRPVPCDVSYRRIPPCSRDFLMQGIGGGGDSGDGTALMRASKGLTFLFEVHLPELYDPPAVCVFSLIPEALPDLSARTTENPDAKIPLCPSPRQIRIGQSARSSEKR
jgi:hypothetical protein